MVKSIYAMNKEELSNLLDALNSPEVESVVNVMKDRFDTAVNKVIQTNDNDDLNRGYIKCCTELFSMKDSVIQLIKQKTQEEIAK